MEKIIIFVKNKIKKTKYNVVSDIIIMSNIFIRVIRYRYNNTQLYK